MPALETPRLTLRRLTPHDAEDMYSYSCDPQVARHVLWDAHRSVSDSRGTIRSYMRRYRLGEPSSWGIVSKKDGRMIGTIGFMWFDADNLSAEVGYSLSRAYWNRGIMTEALLRVLRYAFEELHMNRVEAQYESDNPASGRVMEKCGMVREGCLRQRVYNKGSYRDMVVCSMLREEWLGLAQRAGSAAL